MKTILTRFFALALLAPAVANCSSLPVGQPGEAAEKLAQKMIKAADYDKWQGTAAVTFVFRGDDRVFWDKKRKLIEVQFKKKTVQFSELTGKSLCLEGERRLLDECGELTQAAVKRFYNHTFWLNPVFHIQSPGAERALVVNPALSGVEGEKLLVSFKSGGSTPGDSYLFTADEEGKIADMRMWVSILTIKGMRAVFSDYRTTETGVRVAHHHKLSGLVSVDLSEVKMYAQYPEAGGADRFQGLLELTGGPGSESINRKK